MDYKEISQQMRRDVLGMTHRAQSSHIGSNFGCIDLLTVLYMNADLDQDQVVCKSWAAASVYALLAQKGVIPKEDLEKYGQDNSPYYTILEPTVPTVRAATGAMGYHLPFAVGFALSKKIKKEPGTIYCVISDGECGVGSTWESLLIGAHHNLDNLVLFIDQNGLQAMGAVSDVLNTDPLDKKLEAFRWGVQTVDGHDHQALELALLEAREAKGRPTAIIAKTIKGKGVSFMEHDNIWHYSHVNDEAYARAMAELE